jgi:hypothetical protein
MSYQFFPQNRNQNKKQKAYKQMSQNISLSIDLKLIDQKKLKRITRQSGAEAAFLDLIMIPTPDSPYGEYMIKQRSTKEEVEAKVQTPILGNAKTAVKWEGQ